MERFGYEPIYALAAVAGHCSLLSQSVGRDLFGFSSVQFSSISFILKKSRFEAANRVSFDFNVAYSSR